MRGSDCRHLTGKSLVLLIGGWLWEVVTFQRWSPTKASTVFNGTQFCYSPQVSYRIRII